LLKNCFVKEPSLKSQLHILYAINLNLSSWLGCNSLAGRLAIKSLKKNLLY
jgi:hypothetical protein